MKGADSNAMAVARWNEEGERKKAQLCKIGGRSTGNEFLGGVWNRGLAHTAPKIHSTHLYRQIHPCETAYCTKYIPAVTPPCFESGPQSYSTCGCSPLDYVLSSFLRAIICLSLRSGQWALKRKWDSEQVKQVGLSRGKMSAGEIVRQSFSVFFSTYI